MSEKISNPSVFWVGLAPLGLASNSRSWHVKSAPANSMLLNCQNYTPIATQNPFYEVEAFKGAVSFGIVR